MPSLSKHRALPVGLLLALLAVPSLADGQSHRVESHRVAYETEARETLDVRADLDAVDARLEVADGLNIAAAVLIGVGLATLVGTSIASLLCADDCGAVYGVLAGGAGLAGVGLALFIAATFLGNDARDQRRRLLREHLSFSPLPGGALVTTRWRF